MSSLTYRGIPRHELVDEGDLDDLFEMLGKAAGLVTIQSPNSTGTDSEQLRLEARAMLDGYVARHERRKKQDETVRLRDLELRVERLERK
jgi:hypothetical protein